MDTDRMQLPCWFLFLLGVILQLDVNGIGGDTAHVYYPVVLVCLNGIGMLNSLKILRYQVRMALIQCMVGAQRHQT